jgi:hypothetical protein
MISSLKMITVSHLLAVLLLAYLTSFLTLSPPAEPGSTVAALSSLLLPT